MDEERGLGANRTTVQGAATAELGGGAAACVCISGHPANFAMCLLLNQRNRNDQNSLKKKKKDINPVSQKKKSDTVTCICV